MSPPKDWPPLTPLDWIWISSRWLWLAALPLVAGLRGRLTLPLVFLNLAWLGFALAMSLARMAGSVTRRGVYLAAGVDIAFAGAAIVLTGSLESPLWWGLLVAVLGVALLAGWRGALAVAVCGGAAAGAAGLAAAAVVGGASIGWLADRVRSLAVVVGPEQGGALRGVTRYGRGEGGA